MINESVLFVLQESRNDRVERMQKILNSGHFGMVSSHRSFPYHHEHANRGMRKLEPHEDPKTAKDTFSGDESVWKKHGEDFRGGSKISMKIAFNAGSFKKLTSAVDQLGFKFLPTTGSFGEKGGGVTNEASIVIPGKSKTGVELTQKIMQSLAGEYNQDSFIYAGPETDGEIHLFEVSSRSKSGLPNAYENHFPIGKAELPSPFRELLGRITQKEPEGKIIGATQPRSHGEKHISDPRFGIKPGKGKGITIT
jgi:hypothetical protein